MKKYFLLNILDLIEHIYIYIYIYIYILLKNLLCTIILDQLTFSYQIIWLNIKFKVKGIKIKIY